MKLRSSINRKKPNAIKTTASKPSAQTPETTNQLVLLPGDKPMASKQTEEVKPLLSIGMPIPKEMAQKRAYAMTKAR